MESPSPDMKALFEQALHYDRAGDIYNAIKLYKHVAKHTPHWAPPFERLGTLYKYRQDWKAALHYIKKSVALNPGNQKAWWDLGIAATALKRWRIAKNVWSKFGLHPVMCTITRMVLLIWNRAYAWGVDTDHFGLKPRR